MKPLPDISIGQKLNRLIIVDGPLPSKYGRRYMCACECGTQNVLVYATDLLRSDSRQTKSCGCFQRERTSQARKKNDFPGPFNKLYYTYGRGAIKRGYEFSLTPQELFDLIHEDCVYCGIEPSQETGGRKYFPNIKFNGIDRVDNTKGYIVSNCVPCCWTCNIAKRSLTRDQFKLWITRLVNFNKDLLI